MSESSSPVHDGPHLKDSCTYSIEIAKQFLTLGSAGVAFVLGLALSIGPNGRSAYYLAALAALMMSVLFGLVYLMSVVGHVQRDRNYDVYTVRLQLLAAVQILAFLAAVLAMSKIVYDRVTLEETDRLRTSIGITVGAKTVEYDVPSGASVSIKVFGDDEVELTVLPKP